LHNWRTIGDNLKKLAIDNEINILIVAQRPNMAKNIANVLAKEKITEFEGIHKGHTIYCFEGKFTEFIANIKVTSIDENLYTIKFKEEINKSLDPILFFEQETLKEPLSKLICKNLQMCSRKADALILWNDMSPQGENMCFEIIDNVKTKLPQPISDYIFRAKFKSLTTKHIQEAFDNMVYKPIEHLSLSVDALNTIDLKIRSAFTTYQNNKIFEKYPLVENMARTLIYDTLQTAALSFCVQRAERILNFVPEQYFTINILIKQSSKSFKTIELRWKRERVYDRTSAFALFNEIKPERFATVIDTESVEELLHPPLPLNTNKVLKIACNYFAMSSLETIKVLESLYLNGYISYYQTESTNYGDKFDYQEILEKHQLHSEWGRYALNLIEKGFEKRDVGEMVKETLPIIPVKSSERGRMSTQEWKVYQFITKNFLASISKPAKYMKQEVSFLIGQEQFAIDSTTLIEKGFLEIAPWMNTIVVTEPLERFRRLDEYLIDTKKITDAKTTPMAYLTESELINQMEAYRIGVNGLIPETIHSLIENEYIKINKKKTRSLAPTRVGTAIVKSLNEIDPELVSPKTRARIERECELISLGEADSVDIVNHILSTFRSKYEYFVKNFAKIENVYYTEIVKPVADGKEIMPNLETKDKKKKDILGFSEDVMSYEHCTIYELPKEVVEKKDPVIHCKQ
jgi:DNA topoisomerase III